MTETISSQPSDAGNGNICIYCGLCCDGILFPKTTVNKCDDIAFLKQMGFEFIADGDEFISLQPCVGLNGTLCTLYHDKRRFKVCRGFRCRLLKQYISSEISYNSAIQRIKEVRKRRQSVKELSEMLRAATNGSISSFIMELKQSGKLEDPSFRKVHAKHILDCLILLDLLNRYFYDKNINV